MEQQALDSQQKITFDDRTYRVFALLKRPNSRKPAFDDTKLLELRAGYVRSNPYRSDYKYISAANHLRAGKVAGGNSMGKKVLSMMIWDLLSSGALDGKKRLKATAEELHSATGSARRTPSVSSPMIGWIAANKDILIGAVSFLDKEALQKLGSSSKQTIEVVYSCCGARSTTSCAKFTEKVKSHRKYETPVKCADCAKSFIAFEDFYTDQSQLLSDSGIRFDRLTAEQRALPSGSKEKIEVFFGCCERYIATTPESVKGKITRAHRLEHSQIACNDCSVTQGKIESRVYSFLEGNVATMEHLNLPAASLLKQFRLPTIENMPFDLLVVAPEGTKTLIEVDGGFHFENRDPEAFAKKVEADRVKTELALQGGYNLIRIDERNLMGLTASIQKMLMRAVSGDVERYTVMGKECPGAQQVSEELKGWA